MIATPHPPLTLAGLRARYAAGAASPSEVIDAVLRRVAAQSDDRVWISRMPDETLRQRARELDRIQRDGGAASLPLFGTPFAAASSIAAFIAFSSAAWFAMVLRPSGIVLPGN